MSAKRPAEEGLEEENAAKRVATSANGTAQGPTTRPASASAAAQQQLPQRTGPVIVYRDNEPLPGLKELYLSAGGKEAYVEVMIQPEFVAKDNRRVKTRQIWGDQVYTPDSDVVAAMMHMGYVVNYQQQPLMPAVEFRVILKLAPPQDKYPSKARYVKSRAWCSDNDGCSFQIYKAWFTTRTGAKVDLDPTVDDTPPPFATVLPQSNDRIMTRHTGSKHSKQSQEVSVQYNLCNEPWLKYTTSAIADKGLKPSHWTSARLHSEVLFLETHRERFQICFAGLVGDDDKQKEVFNLAKCKVALPIARLRKVGVPMPADKVEMVESGVEWEEFKWGTTSLHVRGHEVAIKRLQFMSMAAPKAGDAA